MAAATAAKKKKGRGGGGDFEFCEICRLSHDDGRRHRYFPSHLRALSTVLSRFQSRLAALRPLLRRPSPPLTPDHAALDLLWCPFCADALPFDLPSPFAGGNAIRHLASDEHLKNLKHFLWKHAGGVDRVDSLRVSETDFIKWERSCKSLESEAASSGEGCVGPAMGALKDIQFDHTTKNTDNFVKNSFHSFNSSVSLAVMPLQSQTNEGHQVCYPVVSGATVASSISSFVTSSSENEGNVGLQDSHAFSSIGCQPRLLGNNGIGPDVQPIGNGMDRRNDTGKDCNRGSQGNVHSGALPPWLEMSDETGTSSMNEGTKRNQLAIPSSQKGKSRKLNPNRVGAAWAEKRRAELEMEKRGEKLPSNSDANWLPNFGRVWQAGTRKESRKEFEKEKQKLFKEEKQSELPLTVQPYISKRMRTSTP